MAVSVLRGLRDVVDRHRLDRDRHGWFIYGVQYRRRDSALLDRKLTEPVPIPVPVPCACPPSPNASAIGWTPQNYSTLLDWFSQHETEHYPHWMLLALHVTNEFVIHRVVQLGFHVMYKWHTMFEAFYMPHASPAQVNASTTNATTSASTSVLLDTGKLCLLLGTIFIACVIGGGFFLVVDEATYRWNKNNNKNVSIDKAEKRARRKRVPKDVRHFCKKIKITKEDVCLLEQVAEELWPMLSKEGKDPDCWSHRPSYDIYMYLEEAQRRRRVEKKQKERSDKCWAFAPPPAFSFAEVVDPLIVDNVKNMNE